MERMKRITINKKRYDIGFVPIAYDSKFSHWCAYVILGKLKKDLDYDVLDCCTYNENNTFGVDTNHSWNTEMSFEQKYDDALDQIKRLIKSWNRLNRMRKK